MHHVLNPRHSKAKPQLGPVLPKDFMDKVGHGLPFVLQDSYSIKKRNTMVDKVATSPASHDNAKHSLDRWDTDSVLSEN